MEDKVVIILSDMNVWNGNTAGVIRLNCYSKALSDKNVKVILFSPINSLIVEELVEVEKRIYISSKRESKVKHNFLPNVKRNYIFAKSLYNWVKKQKVRPVFLLYPSTNLSFEFFIFITLRVFYKVKVYYELNEIRKYGIKTNSIKQFMIYPLRYILFSLNQLTMSFYSGLVCISRNIRTYAFRYNKNTVVIPILSYVNGINKEKRFHKNPFRILFTGSINVKKENLLEFVCALKKFEEKYTDWSFEMCGSIDDRNKDLICKYLKKYSLTEKVKILGNLSHSDSLRLQSEASLLILPRKNTLQNYYGFSTKLAEYAVSGTPILMTNTGVVGDYFKDNYNCYMVEGYTSDDFYNKLLYVINQSEEQHKRIVENAYKTAEEHFNYLNYSDALKQFFQLMS